MQLAQMSWTKNHNDKQKSPCKNRSPCKQNQSPSKFSQQKSQMQLIEKIVNNLRDHGISVPNELLQKMRDLNEMPPNKKNNIKQNGLSDSFIKLQKVCGTMPQISLIPSARSQKKPVNVSQVHEKQKVIRMLQVKVNDYQFELKKVSQDFAEFKVLSRIDKQKEVRRFRQLYEDSQKRLKDENQNWQNRFKIREIQYQQSIRSYKQQKQSQLSQQVAKRVREKQEFYCKKIEKLSQQNQHLKGQVQSQRKRMMQNKEAEIQQIKHNYETRIVEVIKQKEQEKAKKVQQKQKQIIEVQLVKQKAKTEFKQLQESTNKLKQKLYHDIYIARRQHTQQNQKIQQFKQEKLALLHQIDQKNKQILQTKAAHAAAEFFIQDKKQKVIQVIREDTKKQIQAILQKNATVIEDFKQRLEQLDQCKKEMERLRRISQQQVSKKYQQRPSRDEDVTRIQKLHYDVMCRDQELRKAKIELKKTRLQQQNNQKVYNRIFSCQAKHVDKKSLTKENKDLFVKGGHTTDMRYLLKMCTNSHY